MIVMDVNSLLKTKIALGNSLLLHSIEFKTSELCIISCNNYPVISYVRMDKKCLKCFVKHSAPSLDLFFSCLLYIGHLVDYYLLNFSSLAEVSHIKNVII